MRGIPNSPGLTKIDAEIKVETNLVTKSCLRAERAGLLARQGRFDEAEMELISLQREFSKSPEVRVSAWLAVAKSWLAHATDKPAQAHDHMQRAYALSTAAGVNATRALSAAWLAQFAYWRDDFVGMANFAKVCKSCLVVSDHAAQARLYLVFALGYHFAGRFDLAKPWYVQSREHAYFRNDQATLSALSYNVSARRAVHELRASIFGGDVDAEVRLAQAGLESSQRFDNLLGINVFSQWAPLVQAMISSARMNFSTAIDLYEEHLQSGTAQGRFMNNKASFLADLAWCRFNCGQMSLAALDAQEARNLISGEMYVEDRVTACGRLGQYFSAVGDAPMAARFILEASESSQELAKMQIEICSLIDEVVQ